MDKYKIIIYSLTKAKIDRQIDIPLCMKMFFIIIIHCLVVFCVSKEGVTKGNVGIQHAFILYNMFIKE